MYRLILASRSPRRRELLKLLGHPFICITSAVEEDTVTGELPEHHVTRLSELKARDVGAQRKNGIIIGSDTIVVLDSEILEKPASSGEAVDMLMRLQGQTHTVYTGFALYNTETRAIVTDYETTQVTMRSFTRDIAHKYVDTGEPMDKAGAYGIQGYGAVLITSIEGCYFNVMGLPLARLMEALHAFSGGTFRYFGPCENETTTPSTESCP